MGSFKIDFRPSAQKELGKLPPNVIRRVTAAIDDLADDPFPRDCVKLTGEEGAYRIRVGDYRIVFSVDVVGERVIIQRVRHRKDIYRLF